MLILIAGLSCSAATYFVSSISELQSRINAAAAGDIIVVRDGLYTTSASISINRVGTAANPILIQAETIGGSEIAGTSGFHFDSPAAYVTVQGFRFTHEGNISIASGTSHCRLTRNDIALAIPAGSDVSYININGDDVEIDHNELRNKSTLGEMLDVAGSGSQVARRLWVHHNYFHDFVSPGGNGAETIRLGLSGLSLSTGNALVEYNLFVRCNGENEMISNKSSGNTYRYNTVVDCPGGEISQRHGNDCLYYGNYMRNTQGMRIYGDRHKIFSNYFESNSIGVNMGNGDGDVYNGAPLTSHDRPDDNVVVYNTFIGNSTHYQMGGRTGGLGSSNTVVANNIFFGGGNMAGISSSAPYTGTWSNNFRWQTSSAGNMPASGYTNVNPNLAKDAAGIFHIQAGSPAINTGVGSYDFYGVFAPYTYVSTDMDGQPRDANRDVGADEISTAAVTAHFLTTNDVGPNSGVRSAALRWRSGASNQWNVGVATNWLNTGTGSNDVFLQGDRVSFDDSAGVMTTVTVEGAVAPTSMTNISSVNQFIISGSGKITGATGITKQGASTLTLNTTNDFLGTVTINGGTLKAGNSSALGVSTGGTTITFGGTLDVNGSDLTSEPVTVSGQGAGNVGAIINSGPQQTSALRTVVLGGNATFGGMARWDIRNAGGAASLMSSGQPYSITKVGSNQVSLVAVNPIDPALGDIDIQQGTFAIQTSTAQLGNPNRTMTVRSGATLDLWNLNSAPLNKRVFLENGATVWNESGASIIVGPVFLTNGSASFNVSGVALSLSNNIISGPGGLIKQGPGTLVLRGINSYSGDTTIAAGTLALAGAGEISNCEIISVDALGTLDVTGRTDGTLTLAGGQTLTGDGSVTGALLVGAGAIISPGSSIGAFAVSGSVLLEGTTAMEFNLSSTNDLLVSASVSYGGDLNLVNLGGELQAGDSLKLFEATDYSGAFDRIEPATPAPGLAWDLTQLTTSGTLKVIVASPPSISGVAVSGTELVFSGTGGPPNGGFQILMSFDVAVPLADWTPSGADVFDAAGNFSVNVPVDVNLPRAFYCLKLL